MGVRQCARGAESYSRETSFSYVRPRVLETRVGKMYSAFYLKRIVQLGHRPTGVQP
jgi:hypothetical protein